MRHEIKVTTEETARRLVRRCQVSLHLRVLAVLRRLRSASVFALQERRSVLVKLQFRNDNIRRVDADGNSCAICLFSVHSLDVDDKLLAVDLGDFAFTAFVCAADDDDLVVLADRN